MIVRIVARDSARVSVENVFPSEFDDDSKVTVVQRGKRFGNNTLVNPAISPEPHGHYPHSDREWVLFGWVQFNFPEHDSSFGCGW
jgi:hypothetical protein